MSSEKILLGHVRSLKVFAFRLYICFEKRYTRPHTAETEPEP